MLNFEFYSPTKFYFGKDAEENVARALKAAGAKKVLFHYGGGSIKKSGLYDKIIKQLTAAGVYYWELGGAQANPLSGLVNTGIELCRKRGVDFVLAVGGGSVIDSAKAIAAGAKYKGDVLDFFYGKAPVKTALPAGCVLTISAAGSEGSQSMVITDEATGLKLGTGGDAVRPAFAILNPELTFTLPKHQIAAGITDMSAHVIERYFSNTPDNLITDVWCESLLKVIIETAPKLIKNPRDYTAAAYIMWASTVAHTDILGVGREQDWASHRMEHQFSAKFGVAHGAGLAVIMPAWMNYVAAKNPKKCADFAVGVFNIKPQKSELETARAGVDAFKKFLSSIGMPLTYSELGVKKSELADLIPAIQFSGTLGNYVKLTKEDVKNILYSIDE